nr:MAG TPA: restriction alleviation protein [Caudoviricetes sp.]
MDEIELKPCPFCGCSVGIIGRPIFATPMVVCTNQRSCGAAVSFVGIENEAAAIERWNERKECGK